MTHPPVRAVGLNICRFRGVRVFTREFLAELADMGTRQVRRTGTGSFQLRLRSAVTDTPVRFGRRG